MFNAKSSENFSNSKNLPNLDLLGMLGVRRYKIFRLLLQKAHLCVNPRRLSYFASKLGRRCDFQVGWGKSQKVTEVAIGKHVAVNKHRA